MDLTTSPRTARASALSLAAIGLLSVSAPAAGATTGAPGAPPGPVAPDADADPDGDDAYVLVYDVVDTSLDGTVLDHAHGSFPITAEELAAGVHVDGSDLSGGPAAPAPVDSALVVGQPSPLDEGCRRVTMGYTLATDYPWGTQVYWTYEQEKHWCWHHSAGYVDQIWTDQRFRQVDPFFFPRESNQAHNYVAAWGPSKPKSGHHSRTQWRIENCVPIYGCVSSKSPWVWITVYADGNWHADSGY